MPNIYIGCAGWDYKDWKGPFYPKNLERYNFLKYYSKYFDVVEVNSTFYNIPDEEIVSNWAIRVPPNFKYIIKVWQKITHNLFDSNLESNVSQFFYRMQPLEGKVLTYLLQFPPWFKQTEKHLKQLIHLLKELPSEYNYVIELRDNSWFIPKILLNFINRDNIILGTSYLEGVSPYYFSNQKRYYVRLIGDRQLSVFNKVQRHMPEIIDHLNSHIIKFSKSPDIYEIFIIVNNHYSGFAPETVNQLKKLWKIEFKPFNTQKKLSEFL
jgi:uncharacterized protein YecE (DUF72 family)